MLYWYSSGRVLGGTVSAVMREASARVAVEMPVDSVSGFPENLTLAACGISVRDTTFSFTRGGALDGLWDLMASLVQAMLPHESEQISVGFCSAIGSVLPQLVVRLHKARAALARYLTPPSLSPEPPLPDVVDLRTSALIDTLVHGASELNYSGIVAEVHGSDSLRFELHEPPIPFLIPGIANINLYLDNATVSGMSGFLPCGAAGGQCVYLAGAHSVHMQASMQNLHSLINCRLVVEPTQGGARLEENFMVDATVTEVEMAAEVLVAFEEGLGSSELTIDCVLAKLANASLRYLSANASVGDVRVQTAANNALLDGMGELMGQLVKAGINRVITEVIDGYIGGPVKELINRNLTAHIHLAKAKYDKGCRPLPAVNMTPGSTCSYNSHDPLQHWLHDVHVDLPKLGSSAYGVHSMSCTAMDLCEIRPVTADSGAVAAATVPRSIMLGAELDGLGATCTADWYLNLR